MIYVAGTLLVFFVSLGVGATAALVVGLPERVASGSGGLTETRALEDPVSETSANAKNANSLKFADEASFVHRSTDKNSRSDYTYIDDPRLNGDPDAVVLAAPTPDRGRTGTTTYAHNIGVWYTPVAKKWAIYNQDQVAMSSGEAFEVAVPRPREAFVHRATSSNTSNYSTYLDNPLTNGEPAAVLSVTQNWNPGGGGGVYNDHAIGVRYAAYTKKWVIYNKDGAPMPEGAAFNIAVSGSVESGR